MLVDTHPALLELTGGFDDVRVHVQQIVKIQEAGSHRFLVRPEPHVEKCPGREVASRQGAHRRPGRHVLVLCLLHDLIVGAKLRQGRHVLREYRGDVLDVDIDGVNRVVSLLDQRGNALHAFRGTQRCNFSRDLLLDPTCQLAETVP